MALNATQKNLLEAILRFPFDEIKEFTFEDGTTTFQNGIDNKRALKALQLILEDDITPSQQTKLKEWGVWEDGVEQFRRILNHPAPQNRVRHSGGLHDNQEGLLGLTAKNDTISEVVTKEDVVQYITQEVTRRIEAMQSQNIEPAIIIEAGIVQGLQGFVSAEQLMGISPELRNIIIFNVSVLSLMRDNGITFEQVNQLYEQSPEKLEKIADISVRNLMRYNGITFEQVNQLYEQSPEKLEKIADISVRNLMRYSGITFEQVNQLYDQSPEKLEKIADISVRNLMRDNIITFEQVNQLYEQSPEKLEKIADMSINVRSLMRDNGITFEKVNQLYDQSPEKLEKIADISVRSLMRDNIITFEQVNQLYDQSPETLEGIVSYGARRPLPEEFQERLQSAIQQPSTSIDLVEDAASQQAPDTTVTPLAANRTNAPDTGCCNVM